MDRRGYLSLITAGAGLSTIPSVAARAAHDIDRSSGRPHGPVKRADWVPHTTIDVARDGRATVTISLEGDEAPKMFPLEGNYSKDVEITRGKDAIEREGSTFVWDSSIADELEYTVQLGHTSFGTSTFGVFENCIVSNTLELLLLTGWAPGGFQAMPQTQRFTLEPPAGWSAVMGGTKVEEYTFEAERRLLRQGSPAEMIIVGDVSVHSRSVDDTAVRLVSMPTANGADTAAILDEYEDTLPLFEAYFDHETIYEKLCVMVTGDIEPGIGGQAFANSCLVNEEVELIGDHDTYLQEMAALYRRTVVPGWIKNGFRSYIQRVILWEAGLISEEKLYDDVQAYASDRGEPINDFASARDYEKGAALCAALDMDIRARTDGEATIADWRGQLNDRENEYIPESGGGENRGVSRETSRRVLMDITGVSYADFYDRYVDGREYPTEVLSDDFSLTDPSTVSMATLEVRSVEIPESTKIHAGEEIEITVDVANTGDSPASRPIELLVDEEVKTSREVTLDPGESETVILRHVFDQRGRYTIQIPGGFERQIVVRRPYEKENVELSNTDLEVGDSLRVMVDVSNLADVPTTVEFTLKVEGKSDGPSRESKTIDLAVGETTEVTLLHTFDEPGEFDIFLDERHVGVVNVELPTPTPTTTETPGQPGLGIISAIAGIGSAVSYLVYRTESGDD